MKDLEWKFPEVKEKLPPGEWQEEPDKVQYSDKETGFPCLIVRNPTMGNLCGYVGVTKDHPFFKKSYQDLYDHNLDVHGGLTFTSFCAPEEKLQSICHIVEDGEDDHVWWLGWDCAHSNDVVPAMIEMFKYMTHRTEGIGLYGIVNYKNIDFVKEQNAQLAQQLKACLKDS